MPPTPVASVKAAETWLKGAAGEIRNERLARWSGGPGASWRSAAPGERAWTYQARARWRGVHCAEGRGPGETKVHWRRRDARLNLLAVLALTGGAPFGGEVLSPAKRSRAGS